MFSKRNNGKIKNYIKNAWLEGIPTKLRKIVKSLTQLSYTKNKT